MRRTLLPGITNHEALEALNETILGVFDRWEIPEAERRRLLATQQREDSGSAGLVDDPAVLERVGELLAIDRALARENSSTRGLTAWWIRTPQPGLSGESPLEIMLSQGVHGMQKVRAILEPDTERST